MPPDNVRLIVERSLPRLIALRERVRRAAADHAERAQQRDAILRSSTGGGKQLVLSGGHDDSKVIRGVLETRRRPDEKTRPASIFLDQLLESLLEPLAEIMYPKAVLPLSHWLTPLRSYQWFSPENSQQVGKWCVAALAIVGQAREYGPAQETLHFLVLAMNDRYHHDRALCGASHLADHPDPERIDYGKTIKFNGYTYKLYTQQLAWGRDLPLEVTHGVSELAVYALPDGLVLTHYVWPEPYSETIQRYQNPNLRTLIKPTIYAAYNDWVIKLAELDGIPEYEGLN